MAVSTSWSSLGRGCRVPLQGLGVDIRQVYA